MDINKPFTLEDFEEMCKKLTESKPKDIQVNKRMYDLIYQKVGWEPCNIKINNLLPDNQAILYNSNFKPFEYKFKIE